MLTSQSSSNYNAIDPNILVDSDNKVWLTFGSYWDVIFQYQIDPATGTIMAASARKQLAHRASTVMYDPVEGPSLVHVGSYYYLFVSWDLCCEANPATHKAENLITFHALDLSRNGLDYLFVKSLDFTSWPEIGP